MFGFKKVISNAELCNFENVHARAEVDAAHRYEKNSFEEALFEWLKLCANMRPYRKRADYETVLENYRNNYFNCFLYNNGNVQNDDLKAQFIQKVCNTDVSTKKQLESLFCQIKEICINKLGPFKGGHCLKTPVAIIGSLYPEVDLSAIWYKDELENIKNNHDKCDNNQYMLKIYSDEHVLMIKELKNMYSQFIKNYISDRTPMSAYNKTWSEQSTLHTDSFLSTLQKIQKQHDENVFALQQTKNMLKDAQLNINQLNKKLLSYQRIEAYDKQHIHNMNNIINNMRCRISYLTQSSRPQSSRPYELQFTYDAQPHRQTHYQYDTQQTRVHHNTQPYSTNERSDTQPYCPPTRR